MEADGWTDGTGRVDVTTPNTHPNNNPVDQSRPAVYDSDAGEGALWGWHCGVRGGAGRRRPFIGDSQHGAINQSIYKQADVQAGRQASERCSTSLRLRLWCLVLG